VKQNGQIIPHNIAFGGILRVAQPKKAEGALAVARQKR
jgi:hypothetical protein